jgi:hypothetical protein
MRPTFFVLALLAAIPALGQAQTQAPKLSPPPDASTTLPAHITLSGPSGNCPVGMFAQRRDSGQTLWITSFEDEHQSQKLNPSKPGNTGVHVFLSSHGKATIRQVEIAVYYVAPGTRVLPVSSDNTPPDPRKTFNLSAENGAALKLAGDLLLGPVAGITRVHLVSIDYTDGTSWHAARESACSIEPSRLLLVNAR